jgi:RNA polymerase sigma-70 factor (ECF subfamily)
LGVTADALDDVLQQVFLVAYRRLPELVVGGSQRAWLLAIQRRVIRDHRRTLRRKSPHRLHPTTDPDSLVDDEGRQPDESFARIEAVALIQRWLGKLSRAKREVFILAELEQLTTREIAEATGTRPGTVSSRLRAARKEFEDAAERHRKTTQPGWPLPVGRRRSTLT